MNLIQRIFNPLINTTAPEAVFVQERSYSNLRPFNGEKTPYELGTPFDYKSDYYALRARSWAAFLDTDIVQNAIKKYCLWVVGSGLKLQSDPIENILEQNKINLSKDQLSSFIENAETSFRLFAKLKQSSFNNNQSLHSLAAEALKGALLSGDILCVNRFDGKVPTLEIIDGVFVQDPIGTEHIDEIELRGNRIVNGVEIDAKGTHINYYVVQEGFQEFEKIPAKSEDGKTTFAWLFYGFKYKTHDVRGTSLLSSVLEAVKKLDRYKEATIGAAEENAKIPYTIEHNQHSTGENMMINQVAQSFGKGKGLAQETWAGCDQLATKVAQTTSKQTYNMVPGSTLKRNAGPTDINFGDFLTSNLEIIYATIGIPPEIAIDKFGGAYSGSRAALKSWEYKMMTDRVTFLKDQFYKPFYDFWLDIEILSNRIQAPGYLSAFNVGNFMVLEAYRNSRFIGATVPHIDPLKEINAERKKLGVEFDRTPLTTAEQACENLNSGDYNAVIKKTEAEKKLSEDAGFIEDITKTVE